MSIFKTVDNDSAIKSPSKLTLRQVNQVEIVKPRNEELQDCSARSVGNWEGTVDRGKQTGRDLGARPASARFHPGQYGVLMLRVTDVLEILALKAHVHGGALIDGASGCERMSSGAESIGPWTKTFISKYYIVCKVQIS